MPSTQPLWALYNPEGLWNEPCQAIFGIYDNADDATHTATIHARTMCAEEQPYPDFDCECCVWLIAPFNPNAERFPWQIDGTKDAYSAYSEAGDHTDDAEHAEDDATWQDLACKPTSVFWRDGHGNVLHLTPIAEETCLAQPPR